MRRLRRLPWARIGIGALVAAVAIAFVPPLRRAAAVVTGKALLVVFSPIAPDVSNFDDLAAGTKVLAADGSLLAELDGVQRRQPVPLSSLPEHVPKAVLAAEDANFYSHGGVDPAAVLRAVVRTAQGNTQGGSTITQQLAKLNYTKSERTLFRKVREVQYAVRLEDEYSKDQLLEHYLNQVYFGDGAYGIAAAAQTFFGVPPERLSPEQAATLAGKIKAPETLDPRRRPERVKARRDQVLRAMTRRGWLAAGERDRALAAPLELAPQAPAEAEGTRAPHFVEYVKREAAGIDALGGSPESRGKQLFTGGFTIRTTLDPKAFDAAAKAVQSMLGEESDPEAAVAAVEPGDGAIRVLFGGRNFAARKFDLASQGRRQPGSSFKPFVYLAALRDGIDPRSTFDASSPMDLSYKGERYTVHNYEGRGAGRVGLDQAMAQSINTVFAQLVLDVGPGEVTGAADKLGVADVDDNVGRRPAIALGGLRKGVTPLEQAAAFATFAARGVYAEPYAIASISDRAGREIYRRQPEREQAFADKEVGVLNSALKEVVTRGTGKAAAIGRPVAGKTGTTQNYGDAWFVGFVPQRAMAVWVGHPDRIVPMDDVHGQRVTGGSFPARIFAAAMRAGLAGVPPKEIFTADPDSLGLRRVTPEPPRQLTPPSAVTTLPPVIPTAPPEVTPVPGIAAGDATTTTLAPLSQRRAASTTTSSTTTTTRPPTTTSSSSTTTTTASTTTTTIAARSASQSQE